MGDDLDIKKRYLRRLFTPSVLGIAIGLLNGSISVLGLPKNDTVSLVVVLAFVTAHYL